MVWLDTDRALLLCRKSKILIAKPYDQGFPMQEYMKLLSGTHNDETGALAINIDPDWDTGTKFVYVYWATKGKSGYQEGQRISRFEHEEKQGGTDSAGNYWSELVLWHDTDGFGGTPKWHYGGSLTWGPDKHLYLTLGASLWRMPAASLMLLATDARSNQLLWGQGF